MSSALHEQPYLESWRWMSRQIRCAMDPDEPRLIEHYLAEGRYLNDHVNCGQSSNDIIPTILDVNAAWRVITATALEAHHGALETHDRKG